MPASCFSKQYDAFAEDKVKGVLTKVGSAVEAMGQDPYAPHFYNRCMSFIHNQVWDEIQDEVRLGAVHTHDQ